MSKPRVRLTDIPAYVRTTDAYTSARSTVWGLVPPDGDYRTYLGNRGEKLILGTHDVLLMRIFPRIGPHFEPVIRCYA